MIETFTIKNFRCLQYLSVSPLSKINLITGKNNSGKTTFLEGLFLHVGGNNPELPINVNTFRGQAKLVPNAQEIWGWLFTDKDCQRKIILSSYDDRGKQASLEISLEMSDSSEFPKLGLRGNEDSHHDKDEAEWMSTTSTNQQLVLQFQSDDNVKSRVSAKIYNNQIVFQRDKNMIAPPFPPSIFMATKIRNYAEDAERYSRLEESGLHNEIIEALREIEPKLKRFVVSVTGGIPSLRADISGKRLIPISYMGEGMNRLLSIALAIPVCRHGLLLIDEIENGIHHLALEKVFCSLYQLAEKFGVQLFATTHSLEAIRATHQVYSKKNVYDFRLFMFEERNSKVQISAYDRDTIPQILSQV